MGQCKIALSSADFYYYGEVNRKDVCMANTLLVSTNDDNEGKLAFQQY